MQAYKNTKPGGAMTGQQCRSSNENVRLWLLRRHCSDHRRHMARPASPARHTGQLAMNFPAMMLSSSRKLQTAEMARKAPISTGFGRNRLRRLKLSFPKFLGAIVVVVVLVIFIVGGGPARRASLPEARDTYGPSRWRYICFSVNPNNWAPA